MQTTLAIQKTAVITAFNNADTSGKKLLEDLFPNQKLSGEITDRVKTFEDACAVLGFDSQDISLEVHGKALSKDIKSIAAYTKLIIICRALNEGWVPDWTNDDQYKYYPWFDLSSGSGLSYLDYANAGSRSAVGSRLCLKSEELAKYVSTQFNPEYKDYMLL